LRQALAENRIVSFRRDIDLVRRDGSKIGIDDSAAPICDPDGKITGGVLIFRDVSAARDFTRQRSWEAAHDVLTGLANRREFEGLVEASVASARNTGKHHVVCYMDLDQFKVVNDTCGHAAGDDLLKDLAGLLQSRIRESDTLARLGGDEFGLLLDGCSLERAQFIAADLLAAVGNFRFNRDANVFTLSVSIGLAAVTGDGSSAETLSMADTACYWAKEQGRNRVCVYRTGDSDMAARRREMGWIARINSALAEDRFTLYHQSYLPLNTAAGGCKHFEVLLRMIDEDGNLVQPGSFLPAAERYNLMPAIDRWVVRTVFARYHALVAEWGGEPLTCAINLSGTSLNAEGFIDFIRQQAIEHALPPHSICFEITETAAINNLHKAAEFILECKSMGFLFALDDFGTGTSSFGYLKNLPVDYLKIDGGFVKNLERDAIDKAMTETINHIGHIMGIKTVAEFAENDAIIRELRSMGVDYAQGYGICFPTPLFGPAPQSGPALRDQVEPLLPAHLIQ
jgi:diguanylate cyclase (GGDEF)-like protein